MALRPGWRCQAEVGALPVAVRTLIRAVLPGRVEDQDVHDEVQLTLHQCAVQPAALVRTFDATQRPVCPVDEVAVLRQAERVRKVVRDDLPLLACRMNT